MAAASCLAPTKPPGLLGGAGGQEGQRRYGCRPARLARLLTFFQAGLRAWGSRCGDGGAILARGGRLNVVAEGGLAIAAARRRVDQRKPSWLDAHWSALK